MNILITGAWRDAKDNIEKIENMGHKVAYLQLEKDELPCEYSWVEGIICNGLFLFHPIDKFVNLKYIQLTSAGFDRVPMDFVESHNIEIHNARGVYSIPMAEFAVAGVLQIYKNMNVFTDNQKKCVWNKERNLIELFGKTVCILGCGSVGTECAKRFKVFGCTVIGIDVVTRQDDFFDDIYLMSEIDRVLSESDIIILTLPLTESTYHLIDKDRFDSMKKSAVLINIARGAVADTDALIDALNSHRISGAVLDVFEEEPLNENNPLWKMKNVIVTPHNSFVGDNNNQRLADAIFINLTS